MWERIVVYVQQTVSYARGLVARLKISHASTKHTSLFSVLGAARSIGCGRTQVRPLMCTHDGLSFDVVGLQRPAAR